MHAVPFRDIMLEHSTPAGPQHRVRSATPEDVPLIFELIRGLAEYERLGHEVIGTVDDLREHLFGSRVYCEAIIVEDEAGPAGFALFFHNYSTFRVQPGLYLEDLFVLPQRRRRGLGRALLQRLARIAVERGCGRLEWSVLDWNTPAIGFYQRLGARLMNDWTTCRLDGEALQDLGTPRPL
ncbi:MAG TPA: GNAT family N-acetyltransferase [Chloroflexota bacterium]|jgi:GNAT superfamily N-acetyltransferase|nr:GNAT family N-acetyltransferase [Chloroflexota bacterium]